MNPATRNPIVGIAVIGRCSRGAIGLSAVSKMPKVNEIKYRGYREMLSKKSFIVLHGSKSVGINLSGMNFLLNRSL